MLARGVGKEVAAKFVHQISVHAVEPFVAVSCGAIPSELIDSQLFGHERGASPVLKRVIMAT